MRHIVLAATLLLAAGCGSSTVMDAPAVDHPYDGPLDAPLSYEDDADVMKRSGAAGLALECTGTPTNGGGADYDSGLASTQGSPEGAVDNWMEEDGADFGGLPREGYRLEREGEGRVLYSYDVGGSSKATVVVFSQVRDWQGETGWGVESWAMCDPAEFPAALTDEMGIEIWQDGAGHRVSTGRISSYPGAEHCDWQDIRFITLDFDTPRRRQFVRDVHGEFEHLRTTYDASATLPPDATDTDLRHDGLHLWLASDGSAAYLVNEADPTDVERWPRARQPIYCA